MTITNKNVISFRCHRSMVSWVDTVAPLFPGGRAGFLRQLLVRVALEQTPPARGISKLFKKEQLLELPIGKWYFCEYHEIMPLRHWHKDILEWQAMNIPKNRNNQGNGQTQ